MPDTQGLDRLVWTDIETTGLDPDNDVILEIGFVITDLDFDIIDDFQRVIWDDQVYPSQVEKMPLVVKSMHDNNDLLKECQEEGYDLDEVERELDEWLSGYGVENEPLCGSSVAFDRSFFAVWTPSILNNHFHYRSIDISSVKELCRRLNPALYLRLEEVAPRAEKHRVLPDLRDTITEAQFYATEFLMDGRPVE